MTIKFKWETEFKKTEIGEIPKDWEVISISDSSFAIIMGQSPPSKYYNKEGRGMPFIQGRKDFGDLYITPTTYTEKCGKIAPPNSVLLTVRAPVGDVNITKDEVCIGRGLAAIYNVNGNPTLNRFIYYVLVGLKDYIVSLGERGTTYEEIIKEDLENLLIPYPPSHEQSRIATVLSWFDDLIENKKRQNQILEKVAMAIFKSWFVDFEPFKDEGFVYNEELGKEIPKGWEVKELKEIANIIRGVSFNQRESSFEHFPNSVPILRANNIKEHMIIDFSNMMFIPASKISKEKYLQEKDLVMVASNGNPKLVGKFSIYIPHPQFKSFSVGAFMYCIRIKKNFSYVLSVLNSEYFEHFLSGVISGTNITNLKKSDLEEFKFPLPPQPILQRFHSLVEPLFQKIILNQKQIMILRKIRDALLPKLVFGKLRVEEI